MRKIPTVNTDLRILRLIYCQSQKYSGTVNDLRNLDNNLNTVLFQHHYPFIEKTC